MSKYLLGVFGFVSFDKIIGAGLVTAEAPGSSDNRSLNLWCVIITWLEAFWMLLDNFDNIAI